MQECANVTVHWEAVNNFKDVFGSRIREWKRKKGNEKVGGAPSLNPSTVLFPFPSQLHDKGNLKFARLVEKRSTQPIAFKPYLSH